SCYCGLYRPFTCVYCLTSLFISDISCVGFTCMFSFLYVYNVWDGRVHNVDLWHVPLDFVEPVGTNSDHWEMLGYKFRLRQCKAIVAEDGYKKKQLQVVSSSNYVMVELPPRMFLKRLNVKYVGIVLKQGILTLSMSYAKSGGRDIDRSRGYQHDLDEENDAIANYSVKMKVDAISKIEPIHVFDAGPLQGGGIMQKATCTHELENEEQLEIINNCDDDFWMTKGIRRKRYWLMPISFIPKNFKVLEPYTVEDLDIYVIETYRILCNQQQELKQKKIIQYIPNLLTVDCDKLKQACCAGILLLRLLPPCVISCDPGFPVNWTMTMSSERLAETHLEFATSLRIRMFLLGRSFFVAFVGIVMMWSRIAVDRGHMRSDCEGSSRHADI
ncbi:hypothetical protein KI387_005921, partial [Taxus chinensis]